MSRQTEGTTLSSGARVVDVLALVEKATPGPWSWSENGNILGHMPDGYDETREVCAVYTNDEATGAPNAPAIAASVNYLRTHGRAIAELVEAAKRANGDHTAPHDCYATGPLTGDPYRDLVECPGCRLRAALRAMGETT